MEANRSRWVRWSHCYRKRHLRRLNQGASINWRSEFWTAHLRVIEETPAWWRVVFDYPPFNIVDASIFEALQDLLARMDASPELCGSSYSKARTPSSTLPTLI